MISVPQPTPDFIVSDGPTPGDPLEIWVDWVSGVDLVHGERSGIAHWEGSDLVIAGGMVARRVTGIDPEVAEELRSSGGVLVAALASGVISRLSFGPSTHS